MIGDKGFKDMKIPFGLTTTDLNTGEDYLHTSGNLIKLIRASCSWPGIFSAVEINDKRLVDGGVRNSIPVKFAKKEGAGFIVAVNPGFSISGQKINNVFNLELTGVGRNALIGSFDTKTNVIMYETCNAKRTIFPFSDSNVFVDNGIDSEVLILVPSKEDGSLKTEIIRYCHGSKDNADLLNISDMKFFVDVTMPKMLKDSVCY